MKNRFMWWNPSREAKEARELARTGTLIDDVRACEHRAERLYQPAEEMLAAALRDADPRTALQAIRAATVVVGEARAYMELRDELLGELGRDRAHTAILIQILCPAALSLDSFATHAIQDSPRISLFRQRLERLHNRVDKALDRAEDALRVATDKEGRLVAVGSDLSPLASLLSQAHKNLEILGRATGELEPQMSQGISIQIVCPAAPQSG